MKDGMKKVLLVDDDAVLRIGMKTLVDWQQHGYILIGEASDGAQAMELVEQHRPDIVITDMKMPGMDGLEAARAILEEDPAARIVIVSSLAYDDTMEEAGQIGARGFLYKPFDRETLLAALDKAMED